jgi:hypothetical protein
MTYLPSGPLPSTPDGAYRHRILIDQHISKARGCSSVESLSSNEWIVVAIFRCRGELQDVSPIRNEELRIEIGGAQHEGFDLVAIDERMARTPTRGLIMQFYVLVSRLRQRDSLINP